MQLVAGRVFKFKKSTMHLQNAAMRGEKRSQRTNQSTQRFRGDNLQYIAWTAVDFSAVLYSNVFNMHAEDPG